MCCILRYFFANRIEDRYRTLTRNTPYYLRVCIISVYERVLIGNDDFIRFQFLHLSLTPRVAIVGAYGGAFKVHILSSKVRKRILRVHCNHDTTKCHDKRCKCHVHTDYQHGICLFQSAIHFASFTSFSVSE